MQEELPFGTRYLYLSTEENGYVRFVSITEEPLRVNRNLPVITVDTIRWNRVVWKEFLTKTLL